MRSCVPSSTAEDSGAMRPLRRTLPSSGFIRSVAAPFRPPFAHERMIPGEGPFRAATRAGSPQHLGKEHCLSDLSSFSLFSKKPKETAVGRTPDRGDCTSPGVRLAASKHALIRHHPAVLQVLGLVHESRLFPCAAQASANSELFTNHETRDTKHGFLSNHGLSFIPASYRCNTSFRKS